MKEVKNVKEMLSDKRNPDSSGTDDGRQDIIRVFPRKTKWTPDDDLAFVGEPPLFNVPRLPVFVSIAFTWDIAEGRRIAYAWAQRFQCKVDVWMGGPALTKWRHEWPDNVATSEFTPGMFIKEGVTFTSRGCPKRCPWCLVPKREGELREIGIKPGYIVQDNNLLACSNEHFERVCEMLSEQRKGAEFKGGLDIDYLTEWHVERLKRIRVNELWVACDNEAGVNRLDKARDLLSDFSIEKKRCYVMIGFDYANYTETERRLEAVYEKGFLPFAQLYRGVKWTDHIREWRALANKWSRPAAYRDKKKEVKCV